VIHRVIATFLIKQAGVKRSEADTGADTLIASTARNWISTRAD